MKKIFLLIFLCIFLQGCERMQTTNFQQITLPKTSNYYLICPKDYCNVTPNAYSPVYPVSAEDLFNAFSQIVSRERLVNFVYNIPEQGQFELIARSAVFQFPDDISVQFVALSESTSTVAIYSKARYGFYDFGVNKRRLNNWLSELSRITNPSR